MRARVSSPWTTNPRSRLRVRELLRSVLDRVCAGTAHLGTRLATCSAVTRFTRRVKEIAQAGRAGTHSLEGLGIPGGSYQDMGGPHGSEPSSLLPHPATIVTARPMTACSASQSLCRGLTLPSATPAGSRPHFCSAQTGPAARWRAAVVRCRCVGQRPPVSSSAPAERS